MTDLRTATATLDGPSAPPAARRLCLYQPNYFPRLHYLARVLDSDVFDIADDVQFSRGTGARVEKAQGRHGRSWSYQAHAPIKTAAGRVDLVVPVHDHRRPLFRTEIDYSHKWVPKHLRTIESGYRKALGYPELAPEIAALLGTGVPTLGELTTNTVLWALAKVVSGGAADGTAATVEEVNRLLAQPHPYRLGQAVLGSEVRPAADGDLPAVTADARIIASCRRFGAVEYHCGGVGHGAYMDLDRYRDAGIRVVVQQWDGPPYRQRYGGAFLPNLSVVDLLMNESPEQWSSVLGGTAR
ncbi:MAG: WbqC family protein [Acidimicrobiia bacterium]